MKKYYVVKNGRIPGIYTTWSECKAQVDGFSSAVYKSFTSKDDALSYFNSDLGQNNSSLPANTADEITTAAWAYVDGSYLHSEKKYSYGMVICVDNTEHEFYQAFNNPEMAAMRNVAGEITGSMEAVKFCLQRKIESITIFYDYEGIERWANGDWKTNNPYTTAYAQFIKDARKSMRIDFSKVKGHSGNKYNDMADMLAKKALGIE